MTQKYGHEANKHVPKDFECEICGDQPPTVTWVDLHGEAVCTNCGTPYKVIHYDEDGNRVDKPPTITIKKNWIPILEEYWEKTGEFMGLGNIMNYDQYPRFREACKKFNEWVEKNDKEPKE